MRLPWFNKKTPAIPHEAQLAEEGPAPRIEVFSPTWRFIERYAADRLKAERDKNDSVRLNEIETAFLRGRIDALKTVLRLPEASRDNESLQAGILSRHFAGNEEQ
jgi:uncharacterized protein YigA (DUF484 family)